MPLFGLGTSEIIVILVVLLILFGGKKLPELARAVGKSARELKDSFNNPDSKEKRKRTKKEA